MIWLNACFLPPRQLVPMAAVGENPFGVCLKQFAFLTAVFWSRPPVAVLWVGHWPWCVYRGTYFLERSQPEQHRQSDWFGHCHRASLQRTRWIYALIYIVVPCLCAGCGLPWVQDAGAGSFSCWLQNATEMLLMPSLEIRLLHMNFSHFSHNEDIISQKGERGQLPSWMNAAALCFLTEILISYLCGKRCSEGKRANTNTNFSFAFRILMVGHGLIFWTVSEQGKRHKADCMGLEGKMLVCCLKGRAEKPVSGIERRTLLFTELHVCRWARGDPLLSQSLCQKIPLAGAVHSALPGCWLLSSHWVWG